MTAQPLLVLQEVSKRFGPTQALDGLDLEIRSGECLALVGENGAGKSTLLKILSGQYRPDRGTMRFEGRPFEPRNPRDAIRHGVAIVHQELCLAPHLSVEANILLGREPSRLGFCRARKSKAIVREILARLDHAGLDVDTPVSALTPGLRQIVEIARAIAADAHVVLLDEPTSSLTEVDTRRLFRLIDALKARGMAVVFISHALEEVDRVADRIAVLRDGRLIRVADRADWDRGSIVGTMVGRTIEDLYPARPEAPIAVDAAEPPPLLDAVELTGEIVPKGVSLRLMRGRILGLAGLIGSGRTELARVMMGLDRTIGGRMTICGEPIRPIASARSRIRRGLGLLSEDRAGEGLAVNRSIEENMLYSTYARDARFGLIRSASSRARVRKWVSSLGIKCVSPGQPIRDLSGGNQQKVALARLFEQEGDVLILDEPTRGVDVGAKAEIYRMIREQADHGRAVLLISSYLPELFGLCDDLAVMRDGRLSPVRPIGEWSQEQAMHWATTGVEMAAGSERA
ncbi:ATP-binding cassette domain-containing protein [bacterium]|nr:ATP-binding cassette domain-containing protein [bacterium]